MMTYWGIVALVIMAVIVLLMTTMIVSGIRDATECSWLVAVLVFLFYFGFMVFDLAIVAGMVYGVVKLFS